MLDGDFFDRRLPVAKAPRLCATVQETVKAATGGVTAAAKASEAAATDEVAVEDMVGAEAAATVVEAHIPAGNAAGEASATAVATNDVSADAPELGAAIAPQSSVPPEAPGAGDATTTASRGDAEEESGHAPVGKEPLASEVVPSTLGMTPASDDPLPATGDRKSVV